MQSLLRPAPGDIPCASTGCHQHQHCTGQAKLPSWTCGVLGIVASGNGGLESRRRVSVAAVVAFLGAADGCVDEASRDVAEGHLLAAGAGVEQVGGFFFGAA